MTDDTSRAQTRAGELDAERSAPRGQPVRHPPHHRRAVPDLRRDPRPCSGSAPPTPTIEKAAGINVNLWTGMAMLLVGAIFIAWALARPLAAELGEGESEPAGGRGRGPLRRSPAAASRRGEAARAPSRRSRRRPSGRRPRRRALSARDGPLDLGHATPRSRRAGSRGRRRAGARPRRGRRRAAPPTVASTRAFSAITWRTRRSSGAGSPPAERRVAQAARSRAPRRRRRTRPGARCSRPPACSWAAPESSVTSAPAAELERHGLDRERRGSRSAARGRPRRTATASWSSRPVSRAD